MTLSIIMWSRHCLYMSSGGVPGTLSDVLTMFLRWLLLCFTLYLISQASETNSTNFLTDFMGSFHGPNAVNITNFLSTFQMPACMKQCLPEIDGLLRALSKSNDTKDMAAICSELQASTHCASSAGCSKVFVEAAASAFQFVCLENVQAISEYMECVKKNAMDVQPECEAQCEVQARMIDDAQNNKFKSIFEVPRLCNSTRCLLDCFKNKIDSKCRIGGKSLLDSLLSAMMRGEDHGFENALDWIMPDRCREKPRPLNSTVPLSVGQISSQASKIKKATGENNKKPIEVGQDLTKNAGAPISNSNVDKASFGDGRIDPLMVRLPPAPRTSKNIATPVEAALIIDGEIRTLRYQLFDWQGNPVASPDFETLAKIMTLQLLPFKFPRGRPSETVVLPSEEDEKAAEKRVEERIASEAKDEKTDEDWRFENGPEIASNDGVGVVIGLAVFAATVFYWVWETTRDPS
ncbi:CPG4 domain-containing protein [Trichostrongylus colubriformis]|uniref:CPG4 domain-containing protein n=1 Tax=Trichostrongylus colubriformis TaxID=6319 RepID=A0AAN8G9P7_TRICO